MFGKVAAIVSTNCALSGCHDSMSSQHDMDLSTPGKIYDAWVGIAGYDHCTLTMVRRVLPGNPDMSLVILKVTGKAVCEVSRRMPPPPATALSEAEIETIRAWIAAGAPRDDLADAGGGAADSEAGSGAGGSGGGSDGGDAAPTADGAVTEDAAGSIPEGGTEMDGGLPRCTTSVPCAPWEACIGESCDMPWECYVHHGGNDDDETVKHPCAEDLVPYCGCDGVTFLASSTCPDRPYDHVGACGDGANCEPADVRCAASPPSCGAGMAPSVVAGCWGACIPITSCRCEGSWHCPLYQTIYGCYGYENRCYPYPLPTPPDGGV